MGKISRRPGLRKWTVSRGTGRESGKWAGCETQQRGTPELREGRGCRGPEGQVPQRAQARKTLRGAWAGGGTTADALFTLHRRKQPMKSSVLQTQKRPHCDPAAFVCFLPRRGKREGDVLTVQACPRAPLPAAEPDLAAAARASSDPHSTTFSCSQFPQKEAHAPRPPACGPGVLSVPPGPAALPLPGAGLARPGMIARALPVTQTQAQAWEAPS